MRLTTVTLLALACAAQPITIRPASGQESPAEEAARLREAVTFEVVRLFGVEGKTLVEIYSRIPTHALSFTEQDGRWETGLAFELTVSRGDSVVLRDSWTRKKQVVDRRMLESSKLFFVETHAFLIGPGTYELRGAVVDEAGKELGILRHTLEAPEQNPPVSDLLLAARIVADTAVANAQGYDPMHKNRLVLSPNPGQVYSTAVSPLVYFYLEFENVLSEPLTLERILRFREPGSGTVIKEVRASRSYQPGWSVDYGAVNVAGLKEGSYTLDVSWEAPPGGELPQAYRDLTRRGNFTFIREAADAVPPGPVAAEETAVPPEQPAAPRQVVDYYEGFSEAQLDSVYDLLDIFFEARERSVFDGLTLEGKRSFLNRFWASKDPTPGTPANEYRDEIDARLAVIQSSFTGPTQEGYETPRGRIYLKYGKPDKKVERLLERGFSAPYEIWMYYDSGYKYVFLDEFRNRRYILLTSTDPEEQGRPDWDRRLPREAVEEIIRE